MSHTVNNIMKECPMAATTKKPAAKKTSRKPVHKGYRSFKKARRAEPFFTFEFTQQTVYWLILGLLVIGLGAWVMTLNMKVQAIYDQVEQDSTLVHPAETKKRTVNYKKNRPE